ncbi:MAG TPA: maltose alpha-D-glucosyltransferase [Azospirillaceae bacterium]|nr:maltose alpha-D-glucosyltransferase [Azospirillaceae bacterium]
MIDRQDRLWYKDAVIYQLHVKAFFDANNDGIGDFAGLTRKLDYLQDLGVTALWLLPFYPSPLRDDGYDIADYREVNPAYGNLRDFRLFVREAHARGMRVITELVVNHTSDQHPWFQRARLARPGSNHRNYYVWSDTDQKYQGTRIIFLDTEKSNWTFDPAAKAYFWHRFYSHQPDLNFDNPRVLREVLNSMRYWLDMGVDGLRLDAVPYLVEREGTNNENLHETHDILRKIRAEVDRQYTDRMLLAEANQWPEDVRPYFGDGDECHMSFHFPLMPRIYMALAQEDRHPITDIMRQTPEIPDNCQWAIFLRNHDELTLEMVTDKERDYLWNTYAGDRRMRINLGIRRRLAPLMDNDRRKIELLNSLLLSMPGTPVLYYGDELGMGDNIYLGDRDGVRTPMQWSPDRNGGFSRADPARLYLPAIMDPVYGFQTVNVEAQARSPSSLLNWTKRMVAVRTQRKVFGRGTLHFLYPGNRKVLAYIRRLETDSGVETVLCVANLSRTAQAVELDLKSWKSCVPVEMTGRSAFPPIGDLPYLLTLPSYGFFWFALASETALPAWHIEIPEPLPEFITLVMRDGWRAIASGRAAKELEVEALPGFLAKQRWLGGSIASARIALTAELPGGSDGFLLTRVDVIFSDGEAALPCLLPLAVSWEESAGPLQPYTLARARRGARLGAVYDAVQSDGFVCAVLRAVARGETLAASTGVVRFTPTPLMGTAELEEEVECRRPGVEKANASVQVGDGLVLKVYRRLMVGLHPEVEMGRFLTEIARFSGAPPLYGTVEHVGDDGTPMALAIVQGFVRNQGDGWSVTVDYLDRSLEDVRLGVALPEGEDPHALYLPIAATLGRRTAELHRALATPGGGKAFDPEPVTGADVAGWAGAVRHHIEQAFAILSEVRDPPPEIEALAGRREECLELIGYLADGLEVTAAKTRLHGDFDLTQVLRAQNDVVIIDFEGDHAKSLAERRAKHSALRDVASMLRSFDYAARTAVRRLPLPAGEGSAEVAERLHAHALEWRLRVTVAFLAAYREAIADSPTWPADEDAARRLIDLFVVERACYEISREAAQRSAGLAIPAEGLAAILDAYA